MTDREKFTSRTSTLVDTDFIFNHRMLDLLESDAKRVEGLLDSNKALYARYLGVRSGTGNGRKVSLSTGNPKDKAKERLNLDDYTLHHVQKGESLDSISKRYGVLAVAIKIFNNLPDRNMTGIKEIKIPGPSVNLKLLIDYRDNDKKNRAQERLKIMQIAFQERTLLQDMEQIDRYLKGAKGNYYLASKKFHKDQLDLRNQEKLSTRSTLRKNFQDMGGAESIITAPFADLDKQCTQSSLMARGSLLQWSSTQRSQSPSAAR